MWFITPSRLASCLFVCLFVFFLGGGRFLVLTFQLFKLHVCLRITDEGSVPEMRIWSISFV